VKNFNYINNQQDDDLIDYLKQEWKKLPQPKEALGVFITEYFRTEKLLYDFLKSNNFVLESETEKEQELQNEPRPLRVKEQASFFNELLEIMFRKNHKHYRHSWEMNGNREFINRLSGRNNRQGGRIYSKGGRYSRQGGRNH